MEAIQLAEKLDWETAFHPSNEPFYIVPLSLVWNHTSKRFAGMYTVNNSKPYLPSFHFAFNFPVTLLEYLQMSVKISAKGADQGNNAWYVSS